MLALADRDSFIDSLTSVVVIFQQYLDLRLLPWGTLNLSYFTPKITERSWDDPAHPPKKQKQNTFLIFSHKIQHKIVTLLNCIRQLAKHSPLCGWPIATKTTLSRIFIPNQKLKPAFFFFFLLLYFFFLLCYFLFLLLLFFLTVEKCEIDTKCESSYCSGSETYRAATLHLFSVHTCSMTLIG